MRLALVCIGKLKAGPERLLFERYFKRLTEGARGAGLAGPSCGRSGIPGSPLGGTRAAEGAAIVAALPKGAALVLLDERGSTATSEEWAETSAERGTRRTAYVVVIGGPDGLDSSLATLRIESSSAK